MGMLYIDGKELEYIPNPHCTQCWGKKGYIRQINPASKDVTLKPCGCVKLRIKRTNASPTATQGRKDKDGK